MGAVQFQYIEFNLTLGNGEVCRVRYCDNWSISEHYGRTVHFEFCDNLTISETKYRSEFRTVKLDEIVNPQQAAKEIIETLTGIKFANSTEQQRLL